MKRHVEMIIDYVHTDGDDYQYYDNHGILIRCRDCKFYNGIHCISRLWPSLVDVKPDDYCNYGEVKNDV